MAVQRIWDFPLRKVVVLGLWVFWTGSVLWVLEKANPDHLLFDWFVKVFETFFAAFAAHVLVRLWSVGGEASGWSQLLRSAAVLALVSVGIFLAIFVSAMQAVLLGSPLPGFLVAVAGIVYINRVIGKAEDEYETLTKK